MRKFAVALLMQFAATSAFGYGIAGGACVPDSATVRAGVYETAGFGVRFGGAGTGKIRLICPLDDVDKGGREKISIGMSVIDEDGMEAAARVRVHLRRAKQGTNNWIELGTCDSNTSGKTGPQKLLCPLQEAQKKHVDNWFWFDVEIERTNPRVNVEFLGAEIWYTP